jgi:hypothetical protein
MLLLHLPHSDCHMLMMMLSQPRADDIDDVVISTSDDVDDVVISTSC